jgi:DNA repair protein RadC
LTASLVHPREAFAPAVRGSAAAVIFLHNHPSGDETPSREDRELTARLAACGRLLGIPMLDHVVIGAERYFSFADHRLVDAGP